MSASLGARRVNMRRHGSLIWPSRREAANSTTSTSASVPPMPRRRRHPEIGAAGSQALVTQRAGSSLVNTIMWDVSPMRWRFDRGTSRENVGFLHGTSPISALRRSV